MNHFDLGNELAFNHYFSVYNKQVYGYILAIVKDSFVAEEITQDVFIKLWSCRDLLHNIRNIDNYIFVLCRNRSLNYLRKVRHDQEALAELKKFISDHHSPVDEHLLQCDYEQLLAEAVSSLSPQRRIVFQLSRYEGLSIQEIAEQLHLSPNTVKNHLVVSLKYIRQYLERHAGITALLTFFMFI
ncbi:RNA polymerase sigma-70 factor [Sphingobacterium faecale]|uniref:RNA polymerase sigma-70 factor n=1 Tax=Sphingobacterium faecale TaxID=2803775 RepID=A0ABS1RA12_9SPHI|nr:RNA polymerase sigma-70 factor [Sphingobacterium faecale]MBL1411557.1 RNA polymerase sigma-70 factor [Sphingobacterium faecale]